ncbi:single-stranded DNA-binding protein [Microbacterium sp. LMI1-1-1.1]|uniref:single-stranded DNA-binding protein n=1 Tax=Microbacterium sp. LMI1-1-1.1 TaxID=3135223 RepID=UPI003465C667
MSDTITIVGNIVSDLEERTTRGGDAVAAFRVASGERKYDRDRGEWIDVHTNFYSVSVFGELGRHALASLRKGQRVLLTGRLRLREWETDAKRGVSADITASAIGHDLRWGVTSFDRPRTAAPTTSDPSPERQEDAWAVPDIGAAEGLGDGDLSASAPGPIDGAVADAPSETPTAEPALVGHADAQPF